MAAKVVIEILCLFVLLFFLFQLSSLGLLLVRSHPLDSLDLVSYEV